MTVQDTWDFDDSKDMAREGTYDAQLSFPAPFVEAPEVVETIIKRDGREVPFEKSKITDAIYRAAQSVDDADRDRAESLASGVALYLSKRIQNGPPTVEQVNDAVERVLIELGHGEIALAYARYRDRRARIRDLRSGNLRAILHELREAQDPAREGIIPPKPSLFVRTSQDTLVEWDKVHIVEALVRETGIDRERAELIAVEVQQQLTSARVETLTASLVRELVDAKLVEHGLDAYRRRHMRLGVPLYDAERIICLPDQDEQAPARTPQATDLELAERVKREFALTQVFDQQVGDAHLRGELHIHDLGYVDRLRGCRASLEYLTRHGIGGDGVRSRPPVAAEALLAQAGQFSAALAAHFTGVIALKPFGNVLHTFITGWREELIQGYIRMLLLALAPQDASGHRKSAQTVFDIDMNESGASDLDRQITRALFDCWGDACIWDDPTRTPLLRVFLPLRNMKEPSGRNALLQVAEFAAEGRSIAVQFQGAAECNVSWSLQDVVMGEVAINLPRLAYEASDEAAMMTAMDRVIELATQAHQAKSDFIERLLAVRSFGPLGFLCAKHQGVSFFDPHAAVHNVALVGLNECVEYLAGDSIYHSDEAKLLGLTIAERIRLACDRERHHTGLHLEPVLSTDSRIARRFAGLDLREYPKAVRKVVRHDPITQDLFYTCGIESCTKHGLTPFEQARVEGLFHTYLGGAPVTRVMVPEQGMTARSIADFIRCVARHTEAAGVWFCGA